MYVFAKYEPFSMPRFKGNAIRRLCGSHKSVPGDDAVTVTMVCEPPIWGRYVVIRLEGRNVSLALENVEVYLGQNQTGIPGSLIHD